MSEQNDSQLSPRTRRWFLQGSAAAGAIALAGCVGDDDDDDDDPDDDGVADDPDDDGPDDDDPDDDDPDDDDPDDDPDEPEDLTYEIWAADQGTNTIYIYEGTEGSNDFDPVGTIDTEAEGGLVPHMVHFSSDYEYAAVACTAGARTLVYRTEDREVVGNVETGPSSHFAGFTPDDDAIVVDVIGDSAIVKVEADLENEEFEEVDRIEVDENVEGLTDEEGAPICHSYDNNGRSIHTLGPGYGDAGLVIVDHGDFEVYEAFPGEELPTNCGTMPHPTENKFYLTAGLPSDPEEGVEGVGDYYVLDTDDYSISQHDDTGGIDAHGFWWTTDGEELWVLNRETNDGVVVDPESDDVVDTVEAFGPAQDDTDPAERDAPDILWSSPDGAWMFATLRGPDPVSGDPHAATGITPGFSVLDTETRDIETVIEPDPIEDYSEDDIEDEDVPTPDFHGIGVRPVDDFDVAVGTPPF